MLQRILYNLGEDYREENIIESIHNYIDFDDMIIRKGAIRAYQNEKMIIGLNMRDGILLCEGKSNKDANCSCCHGAGRIITREKAKQKFELKQFEKEMKNVYSTTVCKETLDECPMVYRSSDFIKSSIDFSATIIKELKPIINVKGID